MYLYSLCIFHKHTHRQTPYLLAWRISTGWAEKGVQAPNFHRFIFIFYFLQTYTHRQTQTDTIPVGLAHQHWMSEKGSTDTKFFTDSFFVFTNIHTQTDTDRHHTCWLGASALDERRREYRRALCGLNVSHIRWHTSGSMFFISHVWCVCVCVCV